MNKTETVCAHNIKATGYIQKASNALFFSEREEIPKNGMVTSARLNCLSCGTKRTHFEW